jgi:hypothetical protein
VERLSVGVEGHGPLELRYDLAVLAQAEAGVDQGFEHRLAVALQLARRDGRERRVTDVGESGTAPEREGGRQEALCHEGVASLERGPTRRGQLAEVEGIHILRRDLKKITGPAGN